MNSKLIDILFAGPPIFAVLQTFVHGCYKGYSEYINIENPNMILYGECDKPEAECYDSRTLSKQPRIIVFQEHTSSIYQHTGRNDLKSEHTWVKSIILDIDHRSGPVEWHLDKYEYSYNEKILRIWLHNTEDKKKRIITLFYENNKYFKQFKKNKEQHR